MSDGNNKYVCRWPKFGAPRCDIETRGGTYVCTVERCSGEPEKVWRCRARTIARLLSGYSRSLEAGSKH